MRCGKARRLISERVDGGLGERRSRSLERHLERCPECREVLADFEAIRRDAGSLEAPEPPDRVWLRVKAGLQAAGREPAPPVAVPGFAFAPARWRVAVAAFAAVLLAVGGILVGLRLVRMSAGPADPEKYTLAKLDEAERYYQLAIKSLSEAFAAGRQNLAPEVAEMFQKNLDVVDVTIQACRAAVVAEPDNIEARDFLLAAYREKLTLLDTVLTQEKTEALRKSGGKV
jgi:anti-sigma factor RsiW